MFSWYKYLIVNLVFSHLGFWSGDLFLIAHCPDLCLIVPFDEQVIAITVKVSVAFGKHQHILAKWITHVTNFNIFTILLYTCDMWTVHQGYAHPWRTKRLYI